MANGKAMRGSSTTCSGLIRWTTIERTEHMIGISKLYCGTVEASDPLRYGRRSKDLPSHLLQFSADKKPVVVWNVGRRCNLRCVHCYSQSRDQDYPNESVSYTHLTLPTI